MNLPHSSCAEDYSPLHKKAFFYSNEDHMPLTLSFPIKSTNQRLGLLLGALWILASSAFFVFSFSTYFDWSQGHFSLLPLSTHFPLGDDFIHIWGGPAFCVKNGIAHARQVYDMDIFHAFLKEVTAPWLTFYAHTSPPTNLLLLLPLGFLPYPVAYIFWCLFGVCFLCFALKRAGTPSALFLLLAAPATIINVISGQNGLITASLMGLGLLFHEKKPSRAGILFGLCFLKIQLALLLPVVVLALGNKRMLIAFSITVSCLFLGSAYLFGMDAWQDFLSMTGRVAQKVLVEEKVGPWALLVSVTKFLKSLGMEFKHAMAAQTSMAFIVGILVFDLWRQNKLSFEIKASGLCLGIFFVTPYVLHYDMAVLMFPFIWMGRLRVAQTLPRLTRLARGLLLAAPALSPVIARESGYLVLGCLFLLPAWVLIGAEAGLFNIPALQDRSRSGAV